MSSDGDRILDAEGAELAHHHDQGSFGMAGGVYFASLLMLILFVVIYARLSKPINRLQTKAAKNGESLDNGRELQASWDRSLIIRVPLLVVSLLAQCLVLLVASA